MFCPNCGQPIADTSRFCTYCGFPIPGAQQAVQSADEQPAPSVQPIVPGQPVQEEQPLQVAPPEQTAAYPQPVQEQIPYQQTVQPQIPQYQQTVQPQAPQYQQPLTYQQAAAASQPQPAYQQVPGAPQMPGYAQAAAPAEADTVPVTRQTWFKVIVGLVIALVVFGIGSAIYNNWIVGTINGNRGVEVLDAEGNPTAYAIMNLSGAELTSALKDMGWTFEEKALLWESEDGNDAYYVFGEDDYEYTEEDIAGMKAGGGSDPCIMTVMLDDYDYDSVEDVNAKICKGTTLDQEIDDDDEAIYKIMESESGKRFFVVISHSGYNGLYRVDIANEAAIESGYAEDFLYVDGTTLEDVWEDVADRDIAKG